MNKTFFGIGKDHLKSGDYSAAFDIFEQGAELGDTKSIFGLALMYEHGWAVEKNKRYAAELFASCSEELHRLATMEEDPEAAFILYRCYDDLATERFVEPDADAALEYLEFAADFHYPDAMYWLGVAYMGGTMLPAEYSEEAAKELFENCALMGMPEAMIELGNICYWRKDLDGATEWYEKALEAGDESAKLRLEKLAAGENPTVE